MNHTHDYIGLAPCGCIHAAVVDHGDKETAKAVAEYIRAASRTGKDRMEAAYRLRQAVAALRKVERKAT